jgi:DNA-binding beta-propeller fold protein YncE
VPLILIAAILLARALDVLRFDARAWLSAAVVAASTGAAVVLLVDGEGITHTLGALVGAMLLGWLASTALKEAGNQSFRRGALVMAVAALFALTVRASITLSFKNEDTPVEMLVYTQTSPEIVDLVDRIDTLARTSGLGHSLPIVVDSQDGYSWPWAWYLRDYHEVSYVEMSERPYDPPANAVLLVHTANAYRIDAAGYSQTPYRHRWWFTEEGYRSIEAKGCAEPKGLLKQLACDVTLDASPARVFDGLTDGFGSLSRFFFHRRPVAPGTVGSTDGVAFFPESLSAFDASPAPPAEPTALPDGRIVFGRPGARPGEFRQPADVFVDAAGNIWVADSRNDRVQKFDATGRLLAALGRGGTNLASFREPWSVAVDSQGFVYVADTWAHRVQKFSPALEFVVSWGEPGSAASPGPLELYGPRDIAIGADGTLWLTDTGNKRLLRFSPDGEPLGAFGREGGALGEFSEPVGLAFDAAGNLYVADAWNGRVQRFSPGLTSDASFASGWRSQDILHKPYLAVLTDGRLLVSDPENGRLLLFDAAGRKLGAWTPTPDSLPVGVAASPDGGFVFSDTRRSEVQIVPGALVDSLFK